MIPLTDTASTGEETGSLEWRTVLRVAERSMGNAQHHAFDAVKYMLLIASEMASDERLVDPVLLYQEHSRRSVMQLLVRCEIQPVGHRLAVYLAMRSLSEGAADTTPLEPCRHTVVPRCDGCDTQANSASSSGSSSGTSYSRPSEEGAFRSWTRTQSKAMLLSALDDAHVQLLRPGTTGKRVKVGCPTTTTSKMPSATAPFSGGVFELDTPMEPPQDADCNRFVWVDVVGTWASSRASPAPPEPTQAFETRMQRIREQYASPASVMEDERLQRVLSSASKRPRSYQSVLSSNQQRFASVQQDSLEMVVRSVEMEYGIQLPLGTIARRVQDPEYNLARDRRTTTSSGSLHSHASTARTTERIRHRIEESITMSYCNASMFAEDELRELREEAKAQQRHSPSRSNEKLTNLECTRLEEEKRLLEELSHQHVLVLHTASSPLSARTQSGLLPPTGSEQRSDLLKTHHNQLGLILSNFLEQHMMSGAGSGRAFSEPWVLFIDTHQRVVVTIRPQDTVVVGRMHHHFDVSFRHLRFSEFVGLLIEASVVHFMQHVDAMYATLDEVQRFLAPSTVHSLVFGGRHGARNSLGHEERRRRRQHNVRAYDPDASAIVNYWHAFRVLVLRGGRSVWRKLKRRRTRPRDITTAALRLLNLVNRQSAVFHRVLSESRRMTDLTRAALHALSSHPDDKHARVPLVSRHAYAPSAPQTPHLHRPALASFAPKGQQRPHDHGHLSVAPLWSAAHEHEHRLDATAEEALQDTERLAEEMIERCRQLRHSSSELMSLAMALDAEAYDENLAIIGGVTALFSPMSWWANNMGMNFRCPLLNEEQGYFVTLICYAIFGVLLLWWFYQRYHNVDLAQKMTRAASRIAMCCRRSKR